VSQNTGISFFFKDDERKISTWHFNNYSCRISLIALVCDERMDSNIFKCLRPNTVKLYVVLRSDLTSDKCNWYYALHVLQIVSHQYVSFKTKRFSQDTESFKNRMYIVFTTYSTNSKWDEKLKD